MKQKLMISNSQISNGSERLSLILCPVCDVPSLTVQGGKYCLLHIALLKVTRYVTLLNPTVISQLSYDLTFQRPSRQSITPFSLKPSWLPGHYIHQVSFLCSGLQQSVCRFLFISHCVSSKVPQNPASCLFLPHLPFLRWRHYSGSAFQVHPYADIPKCVLLIQTWFLSASVKHYTMHFMYAHLNIKQHVKFTCQKLNGCFSPRKTCPSYKRPHHSRWQFHPLSSSGRLPTCHIQSNCKSKYNQDPNTSHQPQHFHPGPCHHSLGLFQQPPTAVPVYCQ